MESDIRPYLQTSDLQPLFVVGDCIHVLQSIASASIDCCVTSPPYWNQRQYDMGGIGAEPTSAAYIETILEQTRAIHRVIRPTGSLWLNLGDTYAHKAQLGLPWRIALRMMDEQGWILRNDIIWNKVKGSPDSSRDRLRNGHEYVFHFVKQPHYYYDLDAVRAEPPPPAITKSGRITSPTGVSGVRYKQQIEQSVALNDTEKVAAFAALHEHLEQLQQGRICDFRMIIRGQQRTTHSDSLRVSGRAKELRAHGFYFLVYHPSGAKPSSVWNVLPEDTHGRIHHFAPYPEELCRIPIVATCPQNGIVLDPFCGTGTTNIVAFDLGRKSIGIDLSPEYITIAQNRWSQVTSAATAPSTPKRSHNRTLFDPQKQPRGTD